MQYDIDYINDYWIVQGTIPYSEEQIVDAFNEALNLLGEDWLANFKFNNGNEQIGTHITISLIDIGQKLKVLKRGNNYISLIEKLKSNIEIERIKGLAELNAISFLCVENDIEFELEPQALRAGKTPSYPDFRLRKKEDKSWIYVEIKQPDISAENKIVRIIIKRIIKLIEGYPDFHSVEIMLVRIPNDEELEIIFSKCSFLFSQNNINEFEIKGLGLIVINHIEGIAYYPLEYEEFFDKAVLSQFDATVELNEKGEKIMRQPIACRIMVNDERGRRFLIQASEQLPQNSLNLIWIDGINVPSLKIWNNLIRNQFIDKPELNTKISGFITYSNSINLQNEEFSMIQNVNLVVNNNAEFKVPNWIREKIENQDDEIRKIVVNSFVTFPNRPKA